ncbi:Zn-dependent hydrolase [Marinihelvus fidelis]|uniref:Zn-dependent hydrolase n=1 Tax=Marinihelvus fidelis TaxID=2613842 RepID=A0A5N0TGK6_9GAMM|nr:Zn-dependent hydrolase [Marinihelvus fidelis]KAA9133267.1 Zn-dependent hydrolase [Marinihelvus fidelis]
MTEERRAHDLPEGLPPTPDIDIDRLKATLLKLAEFGYDDSVNAVSRLGFGEADMAARRWLMELMEAEGFSARMDGAGNVYGRLGPKEKASVTMGSHLDSVPSSGIFDGALGVITALEILRTFKAAGIEPNWPLELVATSEEEGRFGGMLGAQAISGDVTPEFLMGAHDADGNRLADAMTAAGLPPLGALEARRPPSSMRAFIELHIEQGPVLDTVGKTIGVVESISGVWKWIIHLRGKADHAGTAPMDMRSDAFMGLADFAHAIPRIIDEHGTDKSRLTVGKVELKPGNPHTIPGEAIFTLVGRDSDAQVMRELQDACNRSLSAIARRHGLRFEYEQVSWLDPMDCSGRITDLFDTLAARRGLSYQRMPSGAGHDTQFLTRITDAGMIFVPSVGGVSHAPDELTHWEDIETGAQLLADAAWILAHEPG